MKTPEGRLEWESILAADRVKEKEVREEKRKQVNKERNERYHNDPEYRAKFLADQKAGRIKNIEKVRARDRIRAKKRSKENCRQRYLKWKEKDPERYRNTHKKRHKSEKSKAWRKKTRLERNVKRREYRRKNRDHFNAMNARRKALKKYTTVDPKGVNKFYKKVFKSEDVFCHWCEKNIPGYEREVDHVLALTRGGHHAIGNLCSSCTECNQHKTDFLIPEWNAVKVGQLFLNLVDYSAIKFIRPRYA